MQTTYAHLIDDSGKRHPMTAEQFARITDGMPVVQRHDADGETVWSLRRLVGHRDDADVYRVAVVATSNDSAAQTALERR